jgi:hypothetical protein
MYRAGLVGALTLGVCLVVLPHDTQAQNRPEFQAFRLDRIGGSAFVAGDYRRQQQNLINGQQTNTSDLLLEEGIEMNGMGSVYHPNFLQWLADGRFGLSQQSVDRDDTTERSNGTIEGYSVDAYVLRPKPLSLHAFSSYDHDFTNRDFNVPLEFTDSRNGFDITHRGALVSTFLLEYTDEQEVSEFRDTDEKTTTYRFTTERRARDPDREWEFTAEHQDITETSAFTTGGSEDFTREENELEFRHVYEFGPQTRPNRLTGNAGYFDQSGFGDNTTLRANEQLSLTHSPTLSSWYQADYSQQTTDELNDKLIEGEIGLSKSVYASLEVSTDLAARHRTFDEGSERAWGPELDLAYRKMTPGGIYRSSLSVSRWYEQEESSGGQRPLVDEAVTLVGTVFVPLSQPNVVPGSVVVTDASQIPYIENVHYILRQTGTFTEIARLIGGLDPIPNGATVLVDYTASFATDADFTSDLINWSNRFTLKWVPVSLYSTYLKRDENLTGGTDPGNLDHFWSLLLGVDWILRGFSTAYEHEWLESDLGLSHVADRARARYDQMVGPDWQLSLGGEAERITYTDTEEIAVGEEDYQTSFGAFGQATNRVGPNLLWRNRAEWRDISGRQETSYTEFISGIEWRYRRVQITVEGRYRMFDQQQSDGDLAAIECRLRRFF